MNVVLNFGDWQVDMRNPASLWADHVLQDYPSYSYVQRGDGQFGGDHTGFLILGNAPANHTASILMAGNFTYKPSGNAVGTSQVEVMNIYGADELPGPRLQMYGDTPWTFYQVGKALQAHDLSPLLAGNQLFIHGGALGDTLVGAAQADSLYGEGGDDRLQGRGASDWQEGRAGADRLIGNQGDDSLSGGDAHDTLTGGNGADHFAFWDALTADTSDVFTDFQHGIDRIEFSYLDIPTIGGAPADTLGTKFLSGTDIDETGGTGIAPEDRVLYDSDSGNLYYDTNGVLEGGRMLIAQVMSGGVPAVLTADDFALVI